MHNEKYVVIKREQWDTFEKNTAFTYGMQPIEDAVVIRTQDAFAASGLGAYAQNIDFHRALNPLDTEGLADLSKYFHGVAQEAEDRLARGECKLPD